MQGNKAKLKRPSLALLRCKISFEIFGLGLIAVQIGLALLPCTSVVYFLVSNISAKIRNKILIRQNLLRRQFEN